MAFENSYCSYGAIADTSYRGGGIGFNKISHLSDLIILASYEFFNPYHDSVANV